jgi:hypothetical protein
MRPTIEQLRSLLICNADTGRLVWKHRTPDMFTGKNAERYCKTWNTRYAGRDAGHVPNSGYRTVIIYDRHYRGSHVVWALVYGEWPKQQLDHRHGVDKGDGIENLRLSTQTENMQNQRKRSNNKSGFKGVSWDSINRKWVVRIRVPHGGKFENLGRFNDPAKGHQAYRQRAVELYGEFARFG